MRSELRVPALLHKQSLFLQEISTILIANLLLALIAQVSIPWQPVPLTFQSVAVVLLGLMLGSQRAVTVVLLYLLEGFSGLPVFAGGLGGFPHFTFGYLVGFLPAAFMAGWLMERGAARHLVTTYLTAIASAAVIFISGVFYLQFLVGWKTAIAVGITPFLGIELLKLLIASLISRRFWVSRTCEN
ncbi:MAG: hypothetical protein A3E84_04625 [Gammaproteobacteria bacterium RIFCSPHIGHO2_12_FULL_42_13]|nr:MAG: hypothetical protein A3E84_04625 [Gammaproteobacteria bacterium RIFCSPHIGHO2_12_FULL_42_13]